ncbi:SLC13 family permease [Legionella maceachernii]|uniref:Inner membrane protein YbhI n=1 Tax=Legionella maceachernii TaxID=466 RepID=A0A0W0VV33_9GAMM|nr:SLC13 family permease [Legionella maceachernii]KTD24180.1 Inner membrane protein YbhI [Legionella maceachernii]SJZ88460.1 divalent anion:Na+ symporter, DASS family [Legionella maceachernii]SUO98805.1 Inner membrane protein ybhI [Legionella maceachernii]
MQLLRFSSYTFNVVGWLVALILPAFLVYLLQETTMNWACTNFVVIFSAALVMWIFRLLPEYVPAVFVILATMLLGLAQQTVLLSGFGSDSFFLALGVFGIGAVLVKSRLFYRLSLLILNHLPKNKFLLQIVLFVIGVLLTPVMTAQSARVSLIAPLLENMRKTAGLSPRSIAANSLACSAFNGCILLSVMFLTGKSSNFVLYGMLSEQTQWQFGWMNWLIVSSVPGALLVLAFFTLLSLKFRSQDSLVVNRLAIKRELYLMGSLTIHEWAAILSIVALILGLAFSSLHQIPSAWISFAIFFILLTSGVLNKDDFKNGINWPFLFYLGAIIGIMRCVQEIGIEAWIINYLSWLGDIAYEQQIIFIILVYVVSWLGGLLFGTMAAPALMFTLLMPVAQQALINTWLVAFVILMATEAWVFPYQSSYYLCFEEWARGNNAYDLRKTLSVNAWFSVLRLVAILLSIPFWRKIGVL